MTVFANYEKLDPEMPDVKFQYSGDACFDLMAAEDVTIYPNESLPTRVKTGLKFNIPRGYELQIRSRSGLAAKHGISILNSPGTVDEQYTGEVQLLFMNHAATPFKIEKYDRVAQGKIAVVPKVILREVEKISERRRGSNGFNSTGVKNT